MSHDRIRVFLSASHVCNGVCQARVHLKDILGG